jgi:IclR family transcriptional regulator, mhp operon transcriptional activator
LLEPTLKREKTRIVHIAHGFEFLGFKIQRGKARLKLTGDLERGLLVLQALQMQPDSSLQELYVFTNISKPSLLRILHTLARSGLVTRRLADGRYRIGATLAHAPSRREHRDRIAEAAAPILERLCQRVSWPSDLMVPAGDHMEIRETTRARSPILLQQERKSGCLSIGCGLPSAAPI